MKLGDQSEWNMYNLKSKAFSLVLDVALIIAALKSIRNVKMLYFKFLKAFAIIRYLQFLLSNFFGY